MRLAEIRIDPFRVPLAAADAQRTWSERRGLLLTLRDEDGRIGQGEAAPLLGYSPDTLADCTAALERIVARGLTEPEDVVASLRGLEAVPAAAFAVETALLDLLAQRRSCSLARMLGAPPREVPLAALIPPTVEAALAARARGIRAFKVKVGSSLDELAALMAIRRELDEAIELRLDANGCWDVAQARAHLESLVALRPSLVEDPVPAALWPALGPVPVPLAADEALGTEHADGVLASPGLRALVLKPARLGGLHACLRWAKVAADRGFEVVVGHTYDGPVAMAAASALALALPRPPLACGLDRHAALAGWAVSAPQILDDRIIDLDRPGLGLPRLQAPNHRQANGGDFRKP